MKKGKLRIGCVVDYLSSDYTIDIVSGASRFCNEVNAELTIIPIGTLRSNTGRFTFHSLAVASHINPRNVDGIIFPTGTQMFNVDAEFLRSYIKSYGNVKVVSVSFPIKGFPSLIIDCATGFKAAVEHLITEHGCKKFTLMTVRGSSLEVTERERIFFETLKEHGIDKDSVQVLYGDFTFYDANSVLNAYLKNNLKESWKPDFDAIVALNDEMALGCIRALRDFGLKVPKDVAVTGFDDIPRGIFESPSLTSVSQQLDLQGYKAASLVYDMIKGKKVDDITVIPSKCIIRHSCGCEYDSLRTFTSPHMEAGFPEVRHDRDESIAQWFTTRDRLINATRLYTGAKSQLTIEDLKQTVNSKVRYFDVKAFALVLYNKPIEQPVMFDYFKLPKEAYILNAFDDTTGYEKEADSADLVFDPNQYMLPPGVLSESGLNTIVYELYNGTIHYGYAVFKISCMDLHSYDLLAGTIATLLAHAYSNTTIINERNLRERQYDQLMNIAVTDELTGLRNRRGFMDLSTSVMNVAQSMNQKGLILFCDMDGLKKINDNFGHDMGDTAIVAEANILKTVFGNKKNIVGRIGGDEFAVLCLDMTEKEYQKARKSIAKMCADWTKKNNSPFNLSISIGCQEFPSADASYNFRILLSEADAKLYIEKHEKHKSQAKEVEKTSQLARFRKDGNNE